MRPEVSEAIRALHDSSVGKYETAHGMSGRFAYLNGNPQGCTQSPCRSKMVLRLVQEAVAGLCTGYRFSATKERIPQIWYADDACFMSDDLAGLQLALDTAWVVARVAGLDMQVKEDGSKTAWQGSYWAEGVEHQITGWRIRLPDGREVPQVGGYKHLGTEEKDRWGGGQDEARKKAVGKCKQLLGAIGRMGVLKEEQVRTAMALAIEGVIGYYARSTVIRAEDCDEIEAERAAVLKRRGFAAGPARVCIHASEAAGGQGHKHAYQVAVAALCAQFDECLNAEENKPERVGIEAHIRAEYVKLGWTGEGEALEWHPEWMEAELSEEAVVQAWLLGRIRMGIRVRTRRGGKGRAAGKETRAEGGPALWEGEGRIQYTAGSKRLAAAGISRWRDVARQGGGWLTWKEAQEKYGLKEGADAEAYKEVIRGLGEAGPSANVFPSVISLGG